MSMNRREFIETSATVAGGAMIGWPGAPEAQATGTAAAQSGAAPTIGIQVGAVSFIDEGTDKVLDLFAEAAHINTLFLATFTCARISGT
jgi:hypothetical protein